jgi:hypothetical protein
MNPVDFAYWLLRNIQQALGRRDFIIVLIAAVSAVVSTVAVNVYFLYRFEPTMTMNAKEFCLTDRHGHCRASLEMQADDSPCLVLLDRDLDKRTSLCLNSEGVPQLAFFSKEGIARAEMHTEPDGAPALIFRGTNGEDSILPETEGNGSPHLLLWNDKKVRAELTAETDDTSNLLLYDSPEEVRMQLTVGPKGTPAARLRNKNGDKLADWTIGDGDSVRLTFGDGNDNNFVSLSANPSAGAALRLTSPRGQNVESLISTDQGAFLSVTKGTQTPVRWPPAHP